MYKIEDIQELIKEGDGLPLDRLAQKQTKYLTAIAQSLVNIQRMMSYSIVNNTKEGKDAKAKRQTRNSASKPAGGTHRGGPRGSTVVL